MYMQRHVQDFPAAGEVVIFDRSWYNRAGVEPVMGFRAPEETERFLQLASGFEKAMADSGILLLKYWLEVSPDEQTRRRQESRITNPRKIWKLSAMDLRSYSRWYDYSIARDAMFAATDTAWARWHIADADDKKRAPLNIISHLLSRVPYKPLAYRDITLPKQQQPGDYLPMICRCNQTQCDGVRQNRQALSGEGPDSAAARLRCRENRARFPGPTGQSGTKFASDRRRRSTSFSSAWRQRRSV
jgi:hypothetical protein